MKMSYHLLKKKPVVFRSFTGLTLKAFEELQPAFCLAYEDDLDKREGRRKRKMQRERGGGRRGALKTTEDKMIFILFYFKHYPVQELQGYLFGMGRPRHGIGSTV